MRASSLLSSPARLVRVGLIPNYRTLVGFRTVRVDERSSAPQPRTNKLPLLAYAWAPQRQPTTNRRHSSSNYNNNSTSNGYTTTTTTTSNSTAVLNQTTSFLRNLDNGAEIFLVGTAHVSKRSAEEVKSLIDVVKPNAVMVELCEQRARKLRTTGQTDPGSDADLLREAFAAMFAPGANIGQQLFKLSLQGMYRFTRSLGLDPGAEFKAAMEAADRHGARLIYGDRDVQETLARLAQSVGFQDIMRLLGGNGPKPPQAMVDFFENESHDGSSGTANNPQGSRLEAQVEALKTRHMARQMSNFLREVSPALASALIDERDEQMVRTLRGLKGRVVGVVGLAHLDGIERRWEQLQHGSRGAVVPAAGLVGGSENSFKR